MVTIFFLFSISIGLLTLISIKTQSAHHEKIMEVLDLISGNFKSLSGNILKLLVLLFKDLLGDSQKSSELYDNPIDAQKLDEILIDSKNPIQDEEIVNDQEIDMAISEFSPELIEIIDSEEEKAA